MGASNRASKFSAGVRVHSLIGSSSEKGAWRRPVLLRGPLAPGHRRSSRILPYLLAWLAAAGTAGSQEFAPPRDFSEAGVTAPSAAIDKLIVGLAADSDLASALEGLSDGEARVHLGERLSDLAGVDLEVERLASGGNVVVRIDREATLERLAQGLARLDQLQAVARLEPLSGQKQGEIELFLEFSDSTPENLRPEIEQLALGSLEFFGDPPRALLTIDLAALLDQATAQLESSPGITFVERSRRLQAH
jgi:hypothetical protein